MVVPKDKPCTIRGYWKPYSLSACIMRAAGVLATAPMEAMPAHGRSSQNQSSTVDGGGGAVKIVFEKHCVTCHGPRGKGDGLEIVGTEVADLTSAATQRKLDIDLLITIHEGRPGKVMPSWKWRLSEQQTKEVLAYVRTLRK